MGTNNNQKKTSIELLEELLTNNRPQRDKLIKRKAELIRELDETNDQIVTLGGVFQGWEVAINLLKKEEEKFAAAAVKPALALVKDETAAPATTTDAPAAAAPAPATDAAPAAAQPASTEQPTTDPAPTAQLN